MPFRTWTDLALQFIGGKVYLGVCLNFLFLEERWRQKSGTASTGVRHANGSAT